MKKQDKQIKWYDHTFRIVILILAGVLIFAGVMSLIQADAVVRYVTAAVITGFVIKELF